MGTARLGLSLALCLAPSAAFAFGEGPAVDAGVRLSHAETHFMPGEPTRIDSAEVHWSEPVAPHVALGLIVGWHSVNQTNNPLTAGRSLEGYHGGVRLDGELVGNRASALVLHTDYRYFRSDDTQPTQSVRFTWQDVRSVLAWRVALVPRTAIELGPEYGWRRGAELDSGAVAQTRDFSDSRWGGYLSIRFATDPTGFVALRLRSGLDRNAALDFVRRF